MNESALAETGRRKSQYIPKSKTLGGYTPTANSVFGIESGQKSKSINKFEGEEQKYKLGGDAPGFGSFGKSFS